MVMIKRGKRGAKGAKNWKPRRRVVRRSKYEVKEVASMTEVVPSGATTANQPYNHYNLSLNTCPRAINVAKGYQYYRIKRVTYVIKPLMDTFVQNQGGSEATVPYLYYMIDRTRLFQAGFDANQLKAMGAKARRLDDKTLTFSFTPSVLTETFDNTLGANQAVQYKLCPWLPTRDITNVGVWNPNTTDHLGVCWIVQQALGNAIGYALERRIQFEFKKPAVPIFEGGVPPIDPDED